MIEIKEEDIEVLFKDFSQHDYYDLTVHRNDDKVSITLLNELGNEFLIKLTELKGSDLDCVKLNQAIAKIMNLVSIKGLVITGKKII